MCWPQSQRPEEESGPAQRLLIPPGDWTKLEPYSVGSFCKCTKVEVGLRLRGYGWCQYLACACGPGSGKRQDWAESLVELGLVASRGRSPLVSRAKAVTGQYFSVNPAAWSPWPHGCWQVLLQAWAVRMSRRCRSVWGHHPGSMHLRNL